MVKDLVFVAPEQVGLPSEKVLEFIQSVQEKRIHLHSFMLVKDGNIFTEAYYQPYDAKFSHRLYECGESLIALAIGMLFDEKKLKLTDKLIEYFPEYTKQNGNGKWLCALTIEETLSMRVTGIGNSYAHGGCVTTATAPTRLREEKWLQSFFTYSDRNIKPNGTLFEHNPSASYVLNALVERVAKKPLLDYIRPILDKIGVSKNLQCITSPDGNAWVANGVMCCLRDLAKIGEFWLYQGVVDGERLISKEYMERATSKQADGVYHGYEPYCIGYGYQIWLHPYGYAMRGLGGQCVYCFPDKNFMFVCQADLYCKIDYFEAPLYYEVVEQLYEPLNEPLQENASAFALLQQKLGTLSIYQQFGEKQSVYIKKVQDVTYQLDDNAIGLQWIRLHFDGDNGLLCYENKRGIKEIPFGLHHLVAFDFSETHYYDMQIGKAGGRKQRAMAFGGWTMENRLLIQANMFDNRIGHIGMTFEFFNDEVAIRFIKCAETCLGEYQGYAYGKAVKGGAL